MRWKSESWKEKNDRNRETWVRWFAWRPIRVNNVKVWFEFIERKIFYNHNYKPSFLIKLFKYEYNSNYRIPEPKIDALDHIEDGEFKF